MVGDGWKLCTDFLTEQGIACQAAPAHLRLQSAVGVAMAAERLGQEGQVSRSGFGSGVSPLEPGGAGAAGKTESGMMDVFSIEADDMILQHPGIFLSRGAFCIVGYKEI